MGESSLNVGPTNCEVSPLLGGSKPSLSIEMKYFSFKTEVMVIWPYRWSRSQVYLQSLSVRVRVPEV